jgi:hypothetical protein
MKMNKRKQGMAFALTMMVLFIGLTILLLGMMAPNASLNSGLVGLTSNSSKFANNNMSATQAFNLAESGVDYTVEWLHNQAAPPASTLAFAPAIWNSASTGSPARSVVSMAGGTFSVELYPYSANAGASEKGYLVESVGTYNGFSEMVAAYVQQTSFGEYSYFNNEGSVDGYWVAGVDSFDGPMHDNNANAAGLNPGSVPDNILWYQNSADTMFNYDAADAYSCCSSTVDWNLNTVGNMVGPASASDWTDIAIGGQGTVATGQADVPLPTTSTVEMNAALGTATAPSGTSPQVLVPSAGGTTDGGIYINGNVNEMALSVSNGGNAANGNVVQTITITQTYPATSPTETVVTTITENPITNTTTEQVATTPTGSSTTTTSSTSTGVTNGAVYVNGSVGGQVSGNPQDATDAWNEGNYSFGTTKTGGVHGVIADNYYNSSGAEVNQNGITIATNASDNLNFDGSLTTNTQRATESNGSYVPESEDSNYMTKAATVGVVSNNIEVVDTSYTGAALTTMQVDGAVLAYNTFDCDNLYYRPLGQFTVMGGYIANQGGYFGVMNMSGTMLGGFAEHYHYDPRLANDPPPFFPTTGNNYLIMSWSRGNASSTLQ